jgi:type IV pilus assembly protein PilP
MSRTLPCLALLALTGCDFLISGKGDPSGAKPAEAPKPPSGKEAPRDPLDDAIAALDEYAYNPIGKRDPFRSFLELEERDPTRGMVGPLQRFELDQYLLVGIIWGVDRPRALVQDPEQVGHVMEVGSYIGKAWGKVTQINSTEVIVTEEYQTIDGELVVNNISMTMSRPGDVAVSQ